jgi:tetratricopeptide (TPR) repeat protein
MSLRKRLWTLDFGLWTALGLLAATAIALITTSDSLKAELSLAGGNLAFLRVQFSSDPAGQLRDRETAELALSGVPGNAYRRAQQALAPIRTCPEPALEPGGPAAAASYALSAQETAELARWIEGSSVIPVCLGLDQIDHAAAYYAWSTQVLPGVEGQYQKLPAQMASAFIKRAFSRHEAGDSASARGDWVRARSFPGAAPYEVFGDLAEKLSADHRAAQQALLASDLAQDPSNGFARIYLAQAYNATRQGREALDAIAPLLKTGSHDTRVWQQQGQALIGLKRLPEAQAALEEAVRLAPGDLQALNRVGVFYMGTGNDKKAEDAFRRALDAKGGQEAYWVWDHLGDLLRKQGRPDEAAQAYRKALTLAPPASAFETSVRQKLAELGK